MIISLRGTNGAGKSHLVRRVMGFYQRRVAVQYPGYSDKRPTGYVCTPYIAGKKYLFVVGHYEIPNGGVDTLPKLDDAYDLARTHSLELGMNVIMEGKNLSDGTTRLLALKSVGCDVAAVFVDEPVERCVESVRARGHKIQEKTIRLIHAKCHRQYDSLKEEEVRCFKGSREQAFEEVYKMLELL